MTTSFIEYFPSTIFFFYLHFKSNTNIDIIVIKKITYRKTRTQISGMINCQTPTDPQNSKNKKTHEERGRGRRQGGQRRGSI